MRWRVRYHRMLTLLVLLNGLSARGDYSNTVMSLNPVAYWPLNETPGADVASSQSINNLDLELHSSGSVTSGVAGAIAADRNTAIALDGSTAFCSLLLIRL